MKDAIYSALKIAQNLIGKTKPMYHPPVVHIPKMGGILPLIPFFGGLSRAFDVDGGMSLSPH